VDKSSNAFTFSNGSNFTYNQTKFNGSYPSFFTTGDALNGNIGSNSSINFSQPLTIFTVIQPTKTSDFFYIMDSATNTSRIAVFYSYNSGFVLSLFAGSSLDYQTGTVSVPRINSYYANTTTSQIFVDGTSVRVGSIGSGFFSGMILGNRFTNSEIWGGHICEIVIYGRILPEAQRQQVEGYLAWKWGLQSSLPATHPFAKWPPPP
jgi:hypothetical protein